MRKVLALWRWILVRHEEVSRPTAKTFGLGWAFERALLPQHSRAPFHLWKADNHDLPIEATDAALAIAGSIDGRRTTQLSRPALVADAVAATDGYLKNESSSTPLRLPPQSAESLGASLQWLTRWKAMAHATQQLIRHRVAGDNTSARAIQAFEGRGAGGASAWQWDTYLLQQVSSPEVQAGLSGKDFSEKPGHRQGPRHAAMVLVANLTGVDVKTVQRDCDVVREIEAPRAITPMD